MACSAIAFLPPAAVSERNAVITARRRETGVQPERQFKFGKTIVKAAPVKIRAGQSEMRPRILAIGVYGGKRCPLCNWDCHRHVFPPHMGAERVAGGQNAECLPILRVDLDGFLQECLGDGAVLPRDAPMV